MFQSPYDHHQGVILKYFLYEVVKIYFLLLLVRDGHMVTETCRSD